MQTVTAAAVVEVAPVAAPGSPEQALLQVRTINLPKRSLLDWIKLLAGGEWVAVKLGRGEIDAIKALFSEEGTIEIKGSGRGFSPDRVLVRLVPREFEEIGLDVLDTERIEMQRLMIRPSAYEQTQPLPARLGNMLSHLHSIKRRRAERRQEYSVLPARIA